MTTTPKTAAAKYYQTAQATLSCRWIHEGAFVHVRYMHTSANGISWYHITQDGEHWVSYPEHHLTRFCL